MPSLQYYLLRIYLWTLQQKQKRSANRNEFRRDTLEKVAEKFSLPNGIVIKNVSANAIPGEWVSFEGREPNGVVFYLHGGAYVAGSIKSHRHLVAHLANYSGFDALHINYRLAPEHPFPSGIDDAVAAYIWLAGQSGADNIIIAGDSAGGGLALSVLLKLKEEKIPLPAAVVLLAPWVNLHDQDSIPDSLEKKDVILTKGTLAQSAAHYAHTTPADNPYISPLFADVSGLPPTLIQVGTYDLLLPGAKAIAKKMKSEGTPVILDEWPKMLHVWQFFIGKLPEAKTALQRISDFMNSNISK